MLVHASNRVELQARLPLAQIGPRGACLRLFTVFIQCLGLPCEEDGRLCIMSFPFSREVSSSDILVLLCPYLS